MRKIRRIARFNLMKHNDFLRRVLGRFLIRSEMAFIIMIRNRAKANERRQWARMLTGPVPSTVAARGTLLDEAWEGARAEGSSARKFAITISRLYQKTYYGFYGQMFHN